MDSVYGHDRYGNATQRCVSTVAVLSVSLETPTKKEITKCKVRIKSLYIHNAKKNTACLEASRPVVKSIITAYRIVGNKPALTYQLSFTDTWYTCRRQLQGKCCRFTWVLQFTEIVIKPGVPLLCNSQIHFDKQPLRTLDFSTCTWECSVSCLITQLHAQRWGCSFRSVMITRAAVS